MIWDFLKSAIQPIADIIDNVHTSDEERLQLKNEMGKIEAKIGMELLNYEKQLLKSQSDIIIAEASGGSWIKQSWRPITMLTFLALIVCDSFGLLATPLAPEAWTLLQIGLGGYVVGRSAEKMAPKLFNKN